MKTRIVIIGLLALGSCVAIAVGKLDPRDTEVWDPEPAVITANPGEPPSDAVLLFDGENTSAWESVDGGPIAWRTVDGALVVEPGTGDIRTIREFCDVQLHIEWQVPEPEADMEGQGRNNSGVFLQERYEIQVLDSFNNRTYSNGQAGAIYKQVIPRVNAMRPPGEWQTYDILYTAPEFDGEQLKTSAFVTVLHNGVAIHHHEEISGPTVFIGTADYEPHGCAPLRLQDHRDRVAFRNIWVRPL